MSNELAEHWLHRIGPRGPLGCCALLAVAVLAFFPLPGWYAHSLHGTNGLLAATVAAVVCWVSASAALLITALLPAHPETAVVRLLLSMAVRMGVPFAAGFLLTTSSYMLSSSGLFGLIVAFYLYTLLFETLLSLRFVQQPVEQGKAA